jgi:hypothetical protein
MSDEPTKADLSRLEAALKTLQPVPGSMAQAEILYRAGRAALRRQIGKWIAAAALGGLALGILGTYQTMRLMLQPEVHIVYKTAPEPKDPRRPTPGAPKEALAKDKPPVSAVQPSASWTSNPLVTWLDNELPTRLGGYPALRQQVLRWGADQLPELPPVAPAGQTRTPSSVFELNRELTGRRPNQPLIPSYFSFFQR